jgi:acetolactate synthase-1/2/3 large subunit
VDETLISSGLATMGFALPSAVAAALARPGRRVVCFTGDGGLGMCLGEIETVKRLDLPVTIVVFNDARLSLIAIKAKPEANGGDNAIGYARTNFATVAQGYGLAGLRASTTEELDTALTTAFALAGPSLIDVDVDPAGYPAILAAIRGPR